MALTSADLRECAFQRLRQSFLLLRIRDDYDAAVLSVYVSGVAVECALRAKRIIVSKEVNSRHRLDELASEANYVSRLKGESLRQCNADVARLTKLWDNLLRYQSTDAFLEFLNLRAIRIATEEGAMKISERRAQSGGRQVAREVAIEVYGCASRIVKFGETFWEKS